MSYDVKAFTPVAPIPSIRMKKSSQVAYFAASIDSSLMRVMKY